MAFNGNGAFNRLFNFVQDRLNSIKPSPDRFDLEFQGVADGLSNCITKDGQTTVVTDIPFNNKKLTLVGDATLDTDALNRRAADARYVQPTATVLTSKYDKTGGVLTGNVEVSVASPSVYFNHPGVKRGRLVVDGGGTLIWQDQAGQNHFYVTSSGAVWTQQLGDLNNRIEDRAQAWSAARRDEANSYSASLHNSQQSTIDDRVYRVMMAGYGEVGGTDGGMSNVAPGVFTGARGTPYGAQVFAYRTLQMHIPSQGGWVNIWVS